MKKLMGILLLVVLATGSVQSKYLITSERQDRFIDSTGTWLLATSEHYNYYTSDGVLEEWKSLSNNDSTSWSTFTYNGNEKEQTWYTYKDNTWSEHCKFIFTYDNQGSEIKRELFMWENEEWNISSTTITSYDDQERITNVVNLNGLGEVYYTEKNTYMGPNLFSSERDYTVKSLPDTRIEYYYGFFNFLEQKVLRKRVNDDSAWTDYTRTLYLHTEGKVSAEVTYKWNKSTEDWDEYIREEFVRDTLSNIIEKTHKYKGQGDSAFSISRTVYTYQNFTTTNSIVVVSTQNSNKLKILNGKLIGFEKPEVFFIDMKGKKYLIPLNEFKMNLSGLASGIYMSVIKDLKTGAFIKGKILVRK